jgi:hypothetical protein
MLDKISSKSEELKIWKVCLITLDQPAKLKAARSRFTLEQLSGHDLVCRTWTGKISSPWRWTTHLTRRQAT